MEIKQNNRRSFFKKLGLSLAALPFSFSAIAALLSDKKPFRPKEEIFKSSFDKVSDRVWLGEEYWAIPMEDWRIRDGRVEFTGVAKFSRVNLLTTAIKAGDGELLISAELGVIDKDKENGSAGFSIGVKDEADPDVKAACYYGKGINAGISLNGHIFIADQTKSLPRDFDHLHCTLQVKTTRFNGNTKLVLSCKDKGGKLAELRYQTDNDLPGLVALVNNFKEKGGSAFWFRSINVSGSKMELQPGNSFGPVLWAMYTLSRGTLKIAAQMPPLGAKDNKKIDLLLRENGKWEKVQTQKIEEQSCTAHFQVEGWDSDKDVPYQLVYQNNGAEYKYSGTIRKEPRDRPLRFGGLTCQHGNGYPYSPLINNLEKHNPDMLYFSGDQLYEQNGGYPIKRQPESDAILSYLGKWYMFGWAFDDIMRDRPTVCTPDDHDVFQGNLWGGGGKKISFAEWRKNSSNHGGYVQIPKMVNVVHKTQCGHMPAPFHPEPLNSGITPWYTDIVYGKVSFAVISDRMFKSGPEQVRQTNDGERRDHITAPLKENELEDMNLKLLGDRQMQFLEHWTNDWEGVDMKVLLSQTLFCNVATHHGQGKMMLYGDMDSGGWPKQKRDDALRLVRKAFAFHINGDQHLPFIVQYSLDEARDAGWTFCTPAISTGYPRWGQPDSIDMPYTDRPAHGLPDTGVYQDVFGNSNYVYAVGNPEDKAAGKNRYEIAQSKASGFGLVTFDTHERTIKMEAFRFMADKEKPTQNDIFPGWPLTISQYDNDGRKAVAYLPQLQMDKPDQVIRIINENDNETVNVFRIKGSAHQPQVYAEGTYTLIVGEGKTIKEYKGIKATVKKSAETFTVNI
jgi:alkaline phosphatase D